MFILIQEEYTPHLIQSLKKEFKLEKQSKLQDTVLNQLLTSLLSESIHHGLYSMTYECMIIFEH